MSASICLRIAKRFAIGVYEITHGEYARLVQATNHTSGEDSCVVNEGNGWEERAGRSWRNLAFPQTPRHPAVCISWDDAMFRSDYTGFRIARDL